MIARAIGPYQPIERLDRGDPYATHRALDARLFGQPVAVTVAPLPGDDEEFVQRFERAAEALAALRHPNILPVLDFGEAREQVYLVAPYLEGPTLAAVLGRPRRPVEAIALTATLCDAIDHAHRLGLAHGTLHPGAIQLANLPPGEDTLYAAWPFLLAFGFAAVLGQPPDADVSPYAPPEPPGDGGDRRADLYALGGILHVLLTGVPPVAGGADEPLATLPAPLATIVRRALAVDPGERFASGAELVQALRDASAERRGVDDRAGVLLEEARVAVTAGKLRAASEAYSAYLLARPGDELARREFATVESRRAEVARRRAELAAAAAAAANAAATPAVPAAPDTARPAEAPTPAPPDAPPHTPPAAPVEPPPPPWSPSVPAGASPPGVPPARFDLRALLPFGGSAPGAPSLPAGEAVGPAATRRAAAGSPPRTFEPIAAPARLRRQAVLPAVLAALLLIAVLALAGVLLARRGQGANADLTPPASRVVGGPAGGAAGNGTRTPPRIATNVPPVLPIAPTIAPITPTPVPTLAPLPPVINDTFDNHASGFPLQPDGREGTGYQNGEYVLQAPDPDGFGIAELTPCPFLDGSTLPGCSFGDLSMEVTIWSNAPTPGGSYGLVFHRQFNGSYSQYFVLIDPTEGTIRLVRFTDPDRVELIKPTPFPAIAKGNGKNRLVVTARGNTITISVNDVGLPVVTDNGPATGLVALRVDAGSAGMEARFDNFVIRPAR